MNGSILLAPFIGPPGIPYRDGAPETPPTEIEARRPQPQTNPSSESTHGNAASLMAADNKTRPPETRRARFEARPHHDSEPLQRPAFGSRRRPAATRIRPRAGGRSRGSVTGRAAAGPARPAIPSVAASAWRPSGVRARYRFEMLVPHRHALVVIWGWIKVIKELDGGAGGAGGIGSAPEDTSIHVWSVSAGESSYFRSRALCRSCAALESRDTLIQRKYAMERK
jgi:hypothetical protein